MNDNQKRLKERVFRACEESLKDNQFVSLVEVLLRMGLLHQVHLDDWKKGKIPFLEEVIQGNLNKISSTMKFFREWVKAKGLIPSRTRYLGRTIKEGKDLQFSKYENSVIEEHYQTHYLSPDLSEKMHKKVQDKLNKPPELIVFRIVRETNCSKCSKSLPQGSFLIMEASSPLCMSCASVDELEFLPSGNASLSRLAKKLSVKHAIVVEFSRSRKRYERQGILVDKESLDQANEELGLSC